ncbi:type VI secretion system contractile sheath small subunit [Nostoc sp. 3335mG]|nr:type VI secretion system contractile sheath small subunit [Nostoc sp. 3335mG]
MSSNSGQKFIARNRKPRVQIEYEDPQTSDRKIELPFVMGVMSDLSGNASKVEKPAVAERDFKPVSMDNFDGYLESVEPGLSFRTKNKLAENEGEQLSVNLTFKSMEDFTPAAVARQVPALKTLLEAREQLANLRLYMDGRADAEATLRKLLADPTLMAALEKAKPAPKTEED